MIDWSDRRAFGDAREAPHPGNRVGVYQGTDQSIHFGGPL